MDRVLDLISAWPCWLQVLTLWAGGVAGLAAWSTACRCLAVIMRGHPNRPQVVVPPRQECNDDDNLTGYCLKVPPCKTVEECTNAVMRQNAK